MYWRPLARSSRLIPPYDERLCLVSRTSSHENVYWRPLARSSRLISTYVERRDPDSRTSSRLGVYWGPLARSSTLIPTYVERRKLLSRTSSRLDARTSSERVGAPTVSLEYLSRPTWRVELWSCDARTSSERVGAPTVSLEYLSRPTWYVELWGPLAPHSDTLVLYKHTLYSVVADRFVGGGKRVSLVQFTKSDFDNSAWIPEKFVPQPYLDEFWKRVEPD